MGWRYRKWKMKRKKEKCEGRKSFPKQEVKNVGAGLRGKSIWKINIHLEKEMAWWRVAGTLTPCSEGVERGGKHGEVFCAVYCNKYLFILQLCYLWAFSSYFFICFLRFLCIFTNLLGLQFNLALYLWAKHLLPNCLFTELLKAFSLRWTTKCSLIFVILRRKEYSWYFVMCVCLLPFITCGPANAFLYGVYKNTLQL
jgi:hypothetical protein